MKRRKQLKILGRESLKKHYVIFVAACLIAAFLSSEFRSSLNFSSARNRDGYEQTYEQIEKDIDSSNGKVTFNIKTGMHSISWQDVLQIMAEDNTQAGRELSEEIRENAIRRSEEGNPMFGRTRGVLSNVVNQVSSGSIIVTAVAAIASITGSENIGIFFLILLGAAVMFLFWFFIQNTFPVVIRRVFLEGMNYDRVTPQRFVFLLRIRKWMKASWIMFVKYICYLLWCFTIVGAAVKRYSYYLVPYIAAENPDMTAREAITLSRKMMKGHKWECFVFELSFLGWEILGMLTLGVFNILYTNPYKVAVFTRYYASLREEAIEKRIPGAELLYDTYLYEQAEDWVIAAKYSDVLDLMEDLPDEEEKQTEAELSGWRGFLARNFGILLMRRAQDREYEKQQAEVVRLQALMDDARGEAYPVRLYPLPEEDRRMLVQSLNYMRHYSVWSLAAIFLSLSIFGWVFEVGMHLVEYGNFVNRGALYGPWLPIYGTGAVLILTLLNRFRRLPALEFAMTVVVCGFLEYMTSFVMEMATGGTKWWDYSGYFLNLHGRICAEGLLTFGVGGLAIVYVLAPMIDNILEKFNEKKVRAVCVILMAAFLADAGYSALHPNTGKGITDIQACLPDAADDHTDTRRI
ncbi:DUF975 family protein [Ruminococcus sp. CLA-AA-H200]|uniref:DUF975 family protein n=1 Tax=Ruminococcus turbiniformis TaxID=2881258 RepID=A0ABS8FZZ1_9FIRM|nr:DUF975 family protein [Ruminococcus turbiniformis]MCC2254249.1 DUF975 family protein [Ruminococcus turbiniformis]